MLQALRFVIQGAGAKVDAVIRKNIVSLLLSMLGHDEVRLQWIAGLGAFCFVSPFFDWLLHVVLLLEPLYSLPSVCSGCGGVMQV